jgi:predicted transposase/invertase (TIGR01784 family)
MRRRKAPRLVSSRIFVKARTFCYTKTNKSTRKTGVGLLRAIQKLLPVNTDLVEINTLELTKLPEKSDGSKLWSWTKFIQSNDEEVLDTLAEKSPQMKKAVGYLKELSADERTRMIFEDREKARRDIASMVDGAIKQERLDFAKKLIKRDRPIEEIIEDTGLSSEEIEDLCNDN